MNDVKEIEQLIKKYTQAIHTQNKDDFYDLWTKKENNVMISNSNFFKGIDNLYSEFLIGGIQNAYTRIDLIIDDQQINFIHKDVAIVILKYHTDCIRRMSGEHYGIQGLETQVVQKTEQGWKLVHIQYHGKEIKHEDQ